ncbi:MAG TPA: hypothetical protein VM492_02355 [Sumerlaeia bacterium]|nr:hypothetical protein [Sumerlaeia bacterium]
MRTISILRFLAIAVSFVFAASTQAFDAEEAKQIEKSLKPEALEPFHAGLKHCDHVERDRALEAFAQAQSLDPDSVDLRFLVAEFATARSKGKSGEKAISQLRIAERAYQEILALKGQGPRRHELEKAQNGADKVERLIKTQAERDTRRKKIGAEILKEQAQEIAKAAEKRKEERKKREEDLKKKREKELEGGGQVGMGRQGSSGRGGAMSGGGMMSGGGGMSRGGGSGGY